MPNTTSPSSLRDQIFEIRYKPNARILDARGEFAEKLSVELDLPRWNVGKDRVDVYDDKQMHRGFVSFKNAGYVIRDAPNRGYFPDKAIQFFNALPGIPQFGTRWVVQRIGVRSRFSTEFEGSFEEARERLSTRYATVTEAAQTAIEATQLVDFNSVLVHEDSQGTFQSQIGPMRAEQLKGLLKDREEYPEVSIYYDIDYWRRPNVETETSEVRRFIRGAARGSWDRHGRLMELLLT